MADMFYNEGKKGILDGSIDLSNDDIKVMLIGADYTPNADHSYIDLGIAGDPARTEISGEGYSRKGLGGTALTEDAIYDLIRFTADSITYPSLKTDDVYGLIIFKDTGNDATSPLIMWIDSNFPVSPSEINMTITWPEGGIFTL